MLERKLRRRGKTAMATVLSLRQYPDNWGPGPTGSGYFLCKMTVRVEPDDEPPFEAKIDTWLLRPDLVVWVGGLVSVLYDPSDHRKVVFDHSIIEAQRVAKRADMAMRARMWSEQQAAGTVGMAGGTSHAWTGAPASGDPLDRLSKLADLHDRGALTDAEFEAQKQKLLGE
jgi:hypothetical protein